MLSLILWNLSLPIRLIPIVWQTGNYSYEVLNFDLGFEGSPLP